MFEVDREIRAKDVNNIYEHLHHADYLRLFEDGRTRYLESLGFTLEELFNQQLMIVVTQMNVRYLRELKAGEIKLRCSDFCLNDKEVCLEQEIINSNGKLASSAEVKLKFVSSRLRRAVRPPEDFIKAAVSTDVDNSL